MKGLQFAIPLRLNLCDPAHNLLQWFGAKLILSFSSLHPARQQASVDEHL